MITFFCHGKCKLKGINNTKGIKRNKYFKIIQT